MNARTSSAAGLALVLALACQQKPSPEMQARLDSLQTVASERDRLVQEMAQNARMLSDISLDLSKVQVRGKLNVSSESPGQAARDSVVQKVRYIATRLTQTEGQLRQSERRLRSLTSVSDSLRATLQATIANYDTIVASQRDQLMAFTAQIDTLKGQNAALTDTVNDLSLRVNTVYYVIGTKDELSSRGIVQETGGSRFLFILWKSGKSLQPSRTLDPSAFTAIDKRQVTSIQLPDSGKAYRIASRQDLSSLATPPDGDGKIHGSVQIAAPERFWAASKYLIIVES